MVDTLLNIFFTVLTFMAGIAVYNGMLAIDAPDEKLGAIRMRRSIRWGIALVITFTIGTLISIWCDI